jgi:ring-1,2-phenylacetyl-CoA epoxidase subunit PaaE
MLVERHVGMDANHALEDYEVARGYVLTCQSYPVADRIVVDFDK